jgi:hypothetical protein
MKKLAMVLGAMLVVAGVAAIYLWQELRSQHERNSEAMARVTMLESASPAGPVGAPSLSEGTQAASSPALVTQAGPAAPISTARKPASGSTVDPMMALVDQIRNSPQGQEFQRVMTRQMLEDKFPNLAKDMNLSKEKAGKLLDLLARRDLDRTLDMLDQSRGAKLDRAARDELARSSADRQRAFDAELKALLGDNHSKWNEYESAATNRQRDGYIRAAKEELRNAISSGGVPLTDAQFTYLDSAITAEQNRIDKEFMGLTMQQQMQRLPEANGRLVQVASSHLNPQQLEGYKRYLQQQESMMGAMDTMGVFSDD